MRARALFAALAIAAVLAAIAAGAAAQDQTTAQQVVMTVAPIRLELAGDPGESLEATISVRNSSGRALRMSTEVVDFVAEDDGATPRFVPANEVSPWAMSRWVSVSPPSFELAPGEKKVVSVTITIPGDAEPGGHYASVLFSSASTDGQGTGVVSKVGSLVLMRVSGEIRESGTVSLDAPRFVGGGPISLTAHFTNDGNVHLKPTGSIVISRWRGKNVAEYPIGDENVLPDSSRSFEATWTDVPSFGIFSTRATMDYGNGITALSPRRYIFVAPWTTILMVVVVFAVGIGMGLFMRRKRE